MKTIIVYRLPNSGDSTYEKYLNHLRNTVPEMCGRDVNLEFRRMKPYQEPMRRFHGQPFSYSMFVASETMEDEWGRVESITARNDREYDELDRSFDRACDVAKDRIFGTFTFFPEV